MTKNIRRALRLMAVVSLTACAGDPVGTGGSGSILGTVTDDTGATVANAAVELSGNGQADRTTNSDADGVYSFASVPAGTYTLTVTPPSGFTVGAPQTASVSVAGGAQASASAFVLNRAGVVTGSVTDDSGANVANAVVRLIGNGQMRQANSGTDGVYTFADVPPGAYTLWITPPCGFTGTATTGSVTVAGGAQASAAAFVLIRTPPASAFVAGLCAHLQTATVADQFSGTVLVTRHGQTVFEGAYGLADREAGIPNSLLTQFRVASMNKMLTAVSVLQLVQAGKVQLHAPLGTYLPDYPNAALAAAVTIHHLLTHTGGTGDIFGSQFMVNRASLREIKDYIDLYGTRSVLFPPGSQWAYSNYGFMLLGAVIERVSGMTYDAYVTEHVLMPAGMTATGAAPEDSLVPGRAVGYTKELVPGTLVSNAPTLPYRGTPAGGWYSTVGDFARFAVALREHRLLDAAHTALALGGKVTIVPGVQYAYGFTDRVQAGRRLVGHNGGDAGMNGELTFEPNGGYVIVVLSNFDPPAASLIEAFILGTLPD
jgi:D-alanyl-D-alanine carboxypeptidase